MHTHRRLQTIAAVASFVLALWAPGSAEAAKAKAKAKATPSAESAATLPELPAETLNHLPDTRVRVFDARSGKLLGMFSTGFVGNFALSAKADELYVASTYHSRTWRGERVDTLEVHDTASLAFKYEVALPTKRAQALNYRGLVRPTANGRFVLVQNATPATSVTVVDLAQRKVVAEVPAPGCYLVYPAASHASRFSMLCGDGKIATVTLDEQGQVSDRQVSDKLFDADTDAWFQHAEQAGDRYWFMSFQGVLTEVNLGGAKAVMTSSRDLIDAAGKKAGWRPGGYQVFTVDVSGRWLVAAMHDKGSEGSHKRPAKQLWIVDLASGKRVATVPGHNIIALTLSRSGQRLHALDAETGALRIWQFGEGGKLKPLTTVKRAGEFVMHLESHD
jgi:methylamine dehydrogenase heavy chain